MSYACSGPETRVETLQSAEHASNTGNAPLYQHSAQGSEWYFLVVLCDLPWNDDPAEHDCMMQHVQRHSALYPLQRYTKASV